LNPTVAVVIVPVLDTPSAAEVGPYFTD